GQLDFDAAVDLPRRERAHRSHGRQTKHPAIPHVEACAVPRALDLVTEELALVQRPAVVRAAILNGVYTALRPAKREADAVGFHHGDLPHRYRLRVGHRLPGHRSSASFACSSTLSSSRSASSGTRSSTWLRNAHTSRSSAAGRERPR